MEARLAMTLRWLAGGQYLDIASLFGVSKSNFMKYITGVLLALDNMLTIRFPFDDPDALAALERGFHLASMERIRGCVAAGTCMGCALIKYASCQ